MRAIVLTAGRRPRSANHCDHLFGCDSQPPNHRTHRRWFVAMVCVFAIAAAVALIDGFLKGLTDMGAAFTSPSALLASASWDRFFAGFGRVSALLFAIVAVVMLIRRKRRKASVPAKT